MTQTRILERLTEIEAKAATVLPHQRRALRREAQRLFHELKRTTA